MTSDRTPLSSPTNSRKRPKIWIDLENTPHIPFFKPIIRELENAGFEVVLTAREAFQTCEMATSYGFKFTKIGRHYGKNRFMKVAGLITRALQLIPFILRERPILAVNHGARAQILSCNLFRIPSILIMDYEHTSAPPLVRPRWEIVPDVIPDDQLHVRDVSRIRKFSGIKEDVYVPEFHPDRKIVEQLGLAGKLVITVRPPATEAHYHNPEAEQLFVLFMERACATPDTRVVLLPRNKAQKDSITRDHPEWFDSGKVIIPQGVVDGLNLLWHSDLAVSGGGTMNREAAALGVPVYSIFRGKLGAVDRALTAQGRLKMITTGEEVSTKILLVRREHGTDRLNSKSQALSDIVAHIVSLAQVR